MATKHWGRDAYFDDNAVSTYGGNQSFADLMLYHMLRVASFEWLWECDGEVGPGATNPNHCDDGNMEEAGTSKYTAVGPTPATISKDTTQVHSGAQSLKVVSTAANDGVRTNALLSITNPTNITGTSLDTLSGPDAYNSMILYDQSTPTGVKEYTNCRIVCTGFTNPANNGTFYVKDSYYHTSTPEGYTKFVNAAGASQTNLSGAFWSYQRRYTIAIWARNVSGNAWNVEVDPGDGSYINVGTIPVDAGGWQLYTYSFWAVSTGSRYIRISDPTGGNTIYIDGILVFRSAHEYAYLNKYGTDGKLTNPDLFSTGGSYTPGVEDIGKWLFVWDDDHNKNSGYYKIIADNGGGVVQVAMRSGNATFTTHTIANLNWRIVDTEAQSHNDAVPLYLGSSGYGVQSPHSSGWRYFSRMSSPPASSSGSRWAITWSAPNDEATFNWSTGAFYLDGPSTQRNLSAPYVISTAVSKQTWSGPYQAAGAFQTHEWFMTDDDRSFFTFVHMGGTFSQYSSFFAGYTGVDTYHPGIEEFVSMFVWNNTSSSDIGWDATDDFTYSGITFDKAGIAVPCGGEVLGYSGATDYVLGQSNAGPNPWSGNEWLHPFIVARDPGGVNGCASERDADIGIFCCRTNMPIMSTFDSANYIHFVSALAWEWSGFTIV